MGSFVLLCSPCPSLLSALWPFSILPGGGVQEALGPVLLEAGHHPAVTWTPFCSVSSVWPHFHL